MDDLSIATIGLFILAVFPGLVSLTVYRVLMPARPQEWGSAVLQGLFYSTVNLACSLPLILLLVFGRDPLDHPLRYCAAVVLALLVVPLLLPIAFIRLLHWRRLTAHILIPYPTAWDAYFDRREECFVLVHLKDGALLGGYYGEHSYAGSFPNDGDIYLEAIYQVDESGKFGDPCPNTRGALLRKDDYVYLELFGDLRSPSLIVG